MVVQAERLLYNTFKYSSIIVEKTVWQNSIVEGDIVMVKCFYIPVGRHASDFELTRYRLNSGMRVVACQTPFLAAPNCDSAVALDRFPVC